ncbi:urease accessory protein UreD [Alkalihalobacterium elongatum]|uniref:urease accessory protein UreD n=1 Tax=Alkalihalobacterium elongatum TaxID=2675466 RepID=UPI001C1F47D4|nr:urease accessory protein UreD [Alkalihalobacterium elongatum]
MNNLSGQLSLHFTPKREKTRLVNCKQVPPLKAGRALYLDDSNKATVYLVETSGGMVSGDDNQVDVTLDEGSHVCLIPQSALKIYPSTSDRASTLKTTVEVGKNAVLEWLPETTIPFQDAIFHSETNVSLTSESTFFYGEILSSGREKSNESFRYKRVKTAMKIYVDGVCQCFDSTNLNWSEVAPQQIGFFEMASYLGSVWYFSPETDHINLQELLSSFEKSKNHRVGAATLDGGLIHFRWLSNDLCLVKKEMELLRESL